MSRKLARRLAQHHLRLRHYRDSHLRLHQHNLFEAYPLVAVVAAWLVRSEDTKSLQCDRCISTEILKCAECLNLTGEMYDHLVSEPNSLLRWFCDNCEKVVMDKNSTTLGNQSEKIDHLIVAIEKMMV